MKSRKRGELTTVAASTDKHKLWLIIGIVLAVVLVLAIVFLSPAKEALFGKGIATGRLPTTTDVSRAGTGTIQRAATPCLNVQLLQADSRDIVYNDQNREVTNANERNYYIGLYRSRVCGRVGCYFQGLESGDFNRAITYSLTNDRCVGTPVPNVCPLVSAFKVSGATGENSREVTCEQGFGISSIQTPTLCSFSNGKGDDTPTQDTCLPAAEIDALCSNDLDDDANNLIDCADPSCSGSAGDAVGNLCGSSETGCTDRFDNDRDGSVDCADSDCEGVAACAAPVGLSCLPNGDVMDDNILDSNDVFALTFVLIAVEDTTCGGTGDASCEVDTGFYACDNGVISETVIPSCTDTSCTPIGDVMDDNILDSNDVFALTFVLIAVEDTTCGGTGDASCEVDTGFYACDNGVISETRIASCS